MTIDSDRVESVAAELRSLAPDTLVRLRRLVELWPGASGAEILAVVERVWAAPVTPAAKALRGMYLGLARA